MKFAIESTTPGLKMCLESTTPGLKLPIEDSVFSTRQLIFGAGTYIQIDGATLDDSKPHRITYQVRLDNFNDSNSDIYGFDDDTKFTRFRRTSNDLRSARGGTGVNFLNIYVQEGVLYTIEENLNPVGTLTVTVSPSGGTEALSVQNSGPSTAMRISGRLSATGVEFLGLIREFKIYNASNTLVHYWPIDDDVGNGGEITDLIGGAHGVLILGAGTWEDRPYG